MIGYIVGPVIALALGMKFTVYTKDETIKALEAKIETIESKIQADVAQQTLVAIAPMVRVVKDLKDTVGV
ncbi:MAG: hypothetical protein CL681_28670 [Blastopirellula sp.]|nr:hypothetical protein [Blastopirellula sp.]